MNKIRKAITFSVMVMTVLSMSVMTAPAQAATDYESGDLIKMDGLSSVYYYADNGKRYVFPNETTYFSWYSDFSGVVTIPQSELESIPIGGNVTMRPGTNLVKITTDPKVYAVEDGGKLVHLADEDTASTLYGEDWADRVVDVPDAFFVNYTQTSEEVSGANYPQGSLVNVDGSVYYITADGARAIDDEAAFEANRFQWDNVIDAPADYELPSMGDPITGAEEALIDTAQTATSGDNGQTGPVGSGLTVALSNNTPASATIPTGAAKAPFTTVNLTASNDGDVTVEDLTVTRFGVGEETELGKVYLYEGMTKVGDGENISNDDLAEFTNVDYVVPAGETKTLTIRATVDGGAEESADGNHGFKIDEASDVATNGASVSGSFPVQGNLMSFSSIPAGALTFDLKDIGADVKVGEEEKDVAEFNLAAVREDVAIQGVTLTNEGTADATDLENYKLYANGEVVAELESASDDTVALQFDEPYLIEEDENEDFTLKANIVSGATENVEFQLDELEDVVGEGQTYGFFVGVGTAAGDLTTENGDAATMEIQTGNLTIEEADDNPSSSDQAKGANDVVFLKAEIKAEDQPITITEMTAQLKLAAEDLSLNQYLENVTVYLDGERVAGPEDILSTNVSTTTETETVANVEFDDSFEVSGIQELTLEVDIIDSAADGDYNAEIDFDTDTNVKAEDDAGDDIAYSEISGVATGNTMTVGTPNPDVVKDATLGDKEVVSGEEIMVGKFLLEAGEAEALDIDNYKVWFDFATTTDGSEDVMTMDDIEDLKVNSEDYVTSPSGTTTFSVSETLEADADKVVEVYLTIDSNISQAKLDGDNQITTYLKVEGEGATSDEAFEKSANGQTMTLAEGSLTATVDASTPSADILLAEATDQELGTWKFEADNTGFNITEVEITAYQDNPTATTNESGVTSLSLSSGDVDNTANQGVFVFDTNIRVDADDDVKVSAMGDLNDVDNLAAGDENVHLELTGYSYESDNTSGVTDKTPTLETGELFNIYDSKITVSSSAGDTDTLTNGENYIMDITVSNDGGVNEADAILETMKFSTSTAGDATIDSIDLRDSNDDSVASFSGATSTIDSGEGTIASGDSKTYQLVVTVSSATDANSATVQLLEEGFSWGDDTTSGISGSLVNKLPSSTYTLKW